MELKDIKGIGEKKIAFLNKLGIFTVNNLLEYFPVSYTHHRHQETTMKRVFTIRILM